MEWTTAIALGAFLLSAMALLSRFRERTEDKSLSIREHEEYRRSNENNISGVKGDFRYEMAMLRQDMRRETDRLEGRIVRLEETRPTTGELDAKINKG